LDGVVNKENVWFMRCIIHRELQWVTGHGLLGPIFLEETVSSECYLSMLHNTLCFTFLLQVCHYKLPGSRRMEPGRTQRMLFWTFDSLVISDRFPDRFACEYNWPWNSLELNPCNYFLWAFHKLKIFPKKPPTVMELRTLIIQACNEITEDMCRRVINITVLVEEVGRLNGGHIEHLINRD
jgi:hypothetical protein